MTCDMNDCPALRIIEEYGRRMDELSVEIKELRGAVASLTSELAHMQGNLQANSLWRTALAWVLMFLLTVYAVIQGKFGNLPILR